jgi:hypothetical protein
MQIRYMMAKRPHRGFVDYDIQCTEGIVCVTYYDSENPRMPLL